MVYRTYYLPLMPNSTESILDYEVEIASLKIEDTFYLPAETGNYSVAGFEMVLNRCVFLDTLYLILTRLEYFLSCFSTAINLSRSFPK